MTEHDLRTLLRDHVETTEPTFTLRPADSIGDGHRARRRRQFVVRGAALATAGGVAAAVAFGIAGGDRSQYVNALDNIHPMTKVALAEYDPQKLPGLIDSHIEAAVGPYLALGPIAFTASDEQHAELPRARWEEAASVSARYGGTGDHRLDVRLGHSRGEAEGDRDTRCAEATRGPDAFLLSCEATTLSDGSVAVTEVSAAFPDPTDPTGFWISLTRENLEKGTKPRWTLDPSVNTSKRLDPAEIFFIRSVEVVHSETFVTSAREVVRAPTYDAALGRFDVPVSALQQVATDPELVIPPPD
ncbi:hypothetical protein [Nocardioides sp. GCM10030258]|uniref:hypothetical protein n=1 Tax=unclassified Nocardioides TaxID=2615069 RepID=UPI003618CED2